MIGHFAFVVVFVKRNGFVIPLNQPATWGVIPRCSQRKPGILAERSYRLNQAFAESRLSHDQTAIVILHRTGNNLRRRGRIIVHQDHQGHGHALIAAHSVITPFRRGPSVVRHNQLILVQEHVAHRDRLIQQSARVTAHIENQPVQGRGAQLFQRIRNFAIRCFVEL